MWRTGMKMNGMERKNVSLGLEKDGRKNNIIR